MYINKEVRLYGYVTSPFVVKVGAFLKYKQIPFELIPVNPVFPHRILKQFPGQHKVPVLTIDGEWRHDSTPLGIWIDQVFPERPILGDTQQETDDILELDQWVTNQLIHGTFRHVVDWEMTNNRWWDAMRNGWKLARIIHDMTPIPFFLRWLWPFLIKYTGFVRRFARTNIDPTEPLDQMKQRQLEELQQHLAGGPFLGGRNRVSLADLSAYTIIVSSHLMGMHGRNIFLKDPIILSWARRVQQQLPDNPLVVPDHLLERSLP